MAMDLPSNFELVDNSTLTEITKFTIKHVYLHHIYSGPNPNQLQIIAGTNGFGSTFVNSWEIYDGVGPKAQVIARANGLHMHSKSWHNSFSMLFEVERFKDSTLQVLGSSVEKEGEWAIVGGTGEFAMARGVIKIKVHEKIPGGEILELDILGYCTMPSRALAVTKSEEWGSQGNFVHDINEKPLRLKSVTVHTSDLFDGIKFTYIAQTGLIRTENLWGFSQNGSEHTLTLGPSEFLKEVSGVIDNSSAPNYFLRSIKLVTNQREFGPFGGTRGGTAFKSSVPEGSMIVAFHGSSGDNWPGHYRMHSIGVYSIPRNVLTTE